MNDYERYEKRVAQQHRYEQAFGTIIAVAVWCLCGYALWQVARRLL